MLSIPKAVPPGWWRSWMCSRAAFRGCFFLFFFLEKGTWGSLWMWGCKCSASLFPGVQGQPPAACLEERQCAVTSRSAWWVVLMISVQSHTCSWSGKKVRDGKKETFSTGDWSSCWKFSGAWGALKILLTKVCPSFKYEKGKKSFRNTANTEKIRSNYLVVIAKEKHFSPKCHCNFQLIGSGAVWVIKLLNIDWFPTLPLLSVYLWRVSQRSFWQTLNNQPWQCGGKRIV